MAYTRDEIDTLKAQILAALQDQKLSQWRRRFLSDMLARLERYGTRTRLSDKQAATLRDILGEPALVHAATQPSKITQFRPQPKRRRRASWVSREIRYLRRRFIRGAVILAVLMIAIFANNLRTSQTDDIGSRVSDAVQSISVRPSEWFASDGFTITDGDTIKMNGAQDGTRLVGFNTPEIFSPGCAAELELGRQAHARLRELVAEAQTVDVEPVACACRPGTEGTDNCNFGRSCAILRTDGTDVGQTLISEGLAVPFICGATSCPPTPKPWCG